jgi:hypothetical protein
VVEDREEEQGDMQRFASVMKGNFSLSAKVLQVSVQKSVSMGVFAKKGNA